MPTTDQLAKAYRLHDQDVPIPEIARRMGVAHNTVRRWVDPEFAEAERAAVRAYKARNRERVRAAERARRADLDRRGSCADCGDPMGIGCYDDGVCSGCRSAAIHARALQIEAMWQRGMTRTEIAAELGWSHNHVQVEIARLRKKGYDLPYRRGGQALANIRAAHARRAAA